MLIYFISCTFVVSLWFNTSVFVWVLLSLSFPELNFLCFWHTSMTLDAVNLEMFKQLDHFCCHGLSPWFIKYSHYLEVRKGQRFWHILVHKSVQKEMLSLLYQEHNVFSVHTYKILRSCKILFITRNIWLEISFFLSHLCILDMHT